MEPLLRGHPDERPPPLERLLDNVNLNINVLISTSDERPPLLKGQFSGTKGVASQEGLHCITIFHETKFDKCYHGCFLLIKSSSSSCSSSSRSSSNGLQPCQVYHL